MALEDRIIKKYNYFNKRKKFSGHTVSRVSKSTSSKNMKNESNSVDDIVELLNKSYSQSKNSSHKKKKQVNSPKKKKKKRKKVWKYKFSKAHIKSKKMDELRVDALNRMEYILNLISTEKPTENNISKIDDYVNEINSFISIHKLSDNQVKEKNILLNKSRDIFKNNKM